jgi:hypothetical protein
VNHVDHRYNIWEPFFTIFPRKIDGNWYFMTIIYQKYNPLFLDMLDANLEDIKYVPMWKYGTILDVIKEI